MRNHGCRAFAGLNMGGGGFNPGDTTTNLWLDASDSSTITKTGSRITQWRDKSGNDRHVANATNGPLVATADQNGLDVVDTSFSARDLSAVYSGGAIIDLDPMTMYVAGYATANPGGYGRIITLWSNTGNDYTNPNYLWLGGSNASSLADAAGGSVSGMTVPAVWSLTFNGSGNALESWLNGTSLASRTIPFAVGSGTKIGICGSGGGSDTMPSKIFEIIITPSTDNTERLGIVEYLTDKWAI